MRIRSYRRQVVLFVIAVLIPSLALVAITIRMLGQERDLAEKRRNEALALRTGELNGQLLARLETIKARELAGVSARTTTVPFPDDPAVALVAWLDNDELVLPWEVDPRRAELLRARREPRFARSVNEGEVAEFATGDFAAATVAYSVAADLADHPSQVALARTMLARALSKAGEDGAARRQALVLLTTPPELVDEYGVPWSLYGADRLIGGDPEGVAIALERLLDAPQWLGPIAAYQSLALAEALVESQPATAGRRLLAEAERRVEITEMATVLRVQLRELLRAQVEGGLAIENRQPVWVPFGDGPWLVSTLPAPDRATLIAVGAGRVVPSLAAAAARPEGDTASAIEVFTSPDRPGAFLGSSFPGLRVAFSPPGDDAGEATIQRASLLGVLLLVLGLTVVGASLLLRDVRRETRLWEMRSRFVSSVSHELTTPLTSIRMFAETLRLGRLADPRKRERYLDTIVDESHRLGRLVDNVLDFSKIDRGQKVYRFGWADLADVVNRAAEAIRHRVEAHGLVLDVTVDASPTAYVDADAIEQAVLNLLTNAVKYSEPRQTVELGLFTGKGSAEIRVRDRGIGIPADERERIFEEFYRSDTPENERVPGTGLGLALSSHIARAHGGDIRVVSEPGAGSTFTLRIPLRRPPRAPTGEASP